MRLEPVDPSNIEGFRRMVVGYWQELMPQSNVVQDGERQKAYFQESFNWDGGNRHPYWALVDGRKVGFASFAVDEADNAARIEDFYVVPEERRKGYGAALVQELYKHLDKRGVVLIELHVRRDNPNALAFWEAQGFRIASYRLRQYRDPKTGKSFIGALSSDFA
jgi:ribosomal protein S18 acetylase RimI-like enzyme